MNNYKITIQYDGTDYFGWQSQPSGNTIQDVITRSIEQITKNKVNLIGSGRTDSGVHALGQIANFNIENNLDLQRFKHSLNSILPSSIAINKIQLVSDDFHSRFDALKRSYTYLISKGKSPFYNKYSYRYEILDDLDLQKLNSLSKVLIGEHDFTSFCKTKSDVENKICNVTSIWWRATREIIVFRIDADRFLHGMVRTIVGTILHAFREKHNEEYLKKILLLESRELAGQSVPAKGLFLFKVKY